MEKYPTMGGKIDKKQSNPKGRISYERKSMF